MLLNSHCLIMTSTIWIAWVVTFYLWIIVDYSLLYHKDKEFYSFFFWKVIILHFTMLRYMLLNIWWIDFQVITKNLYKQLLRGNDKRLMKIRKRMEPKWEPCGTPQWAKMTFEMDWLICTISSVKKFSIQSIRGQLMARWFTISKPVKCHFKIEVNRVHWFTFV